MSAEIHPRAIIGTRNTIHDSVRIGEDVTVGDDNEIQPHVTISGPAVIGSGNRIATGTVIGGLSRQRFDARDRRETPTSAARTVIGSGCLIFELVTIHRAMVTETRIEDEVAIGAHSHVAHDCIVSRRAIVAVNVSLGGFSRIGRDANLGLGVTVRPRVVVGARVMCGMSSAVVEHVPPFVTVVGVPARIIGVNRIGIAREGLSSGAAADIHRAYSRSHHLTDPPLLAAEHALFRAARDAYGAHIAELKWPGSIE